MEKKKSKAKLESMLGAVERRVPATKPAKSSCTRIYCV
ncbi:hypothetical protein Snas_2456 [Stackebrandtia nassauensis DSM 44728]|uniref:Uncharacterized protein n=1 Tax=Stackebrandtia nassauensis (strain DSM 44728 / CIP 108903 / NRRL B-16338 / NBRC 102104 / LLR-40K-21) TaxID=446470 RepID=D3Q4V9_STANL|nr:hypothetical protein Snas_2456 [Stackebrandtia nassauensis DSM 44728]